MFWNLDPMIDSNSTGLSPVGCRLKLSTIRLPFNISICSFAYWQPWPKDGRGLTRLTSPKTNEIKWAAAYSGSTCCWCNPKEKNPISCLALFWTWLTLLSTTTIYGKLRLPPMGFQFDSSWQSHSDRSNTCSKWLETVWRSCCWHNSEFRKTCIFHFCPHTILSDGPMWSSKLSH